MDVDSAVTASQERRFSTRSWGPPASESSRYGKKGAGWTGERELGSWLTMMPKQRPRRLSWLNPIALIRARNDFVARIADPVPELRRAWMAGVAPEKLSLDLGYDEFSFLLMGDTGEGDFSQWALLPSLLSHATDASFLVICSDVLYPLGDVNEYDAKFFTPYHDLALPIYALPGNHDWYDSLAAFMFYFGGRDDPPPDLPIDPGPGSLMRRLRVGSRLLLRRVLWRDPSEAGDLNRVKELRSSRNKDRQRPPLPQPGPYFVLDTKHLRIVCIDTGILGTLDEDQGRWLLDVSRGNKPKILLTGKPLIVNGHTSPCAIDGAPGGFRTVLDLVRAPAFNYRLTLGGDTHNYQHYIDHLDGGELHHVVSGGGGAFMHATHTIPRIRRNTAAEAEPSARIFFGAEDPEDEFKCYPLRRDSMAAYSRVLQSKLDKVTFRRGRDKPPLINLTLTDDEAGLYLKEEFDIDSAGNRPIQPVRLDRRVRALGWFLYRLGGQKTFHRVFSPFLDWDKPPFYKNFIRFDVRAGGATVRCFGVIGWKEAEANPPQEDVIELAW
jgi:Calcineurin-like phosphoesterase